MSCVLLLHPVAFPINPFAVLFPSFSFYTQLIFFSFLSACSEPSLPFPLQEDLPEGVRAAELGRADGYRHHRQLQELQLDGGEVLQGDPRSPALFLKLQLLKIVFRFIYRLY